ncbi:MAG TPA: O-antigen ligase family protein [Methylotenera sp.]|nr:O-antigen ligase family protein [Methylotenera sp.]
MNNFSKSTLQLSPALIVGISLCMAVVMGVFVALFVNNVGDHLGILLALPGAIVVGLIFLLDRYTLFFLIILFRAALDPLLEITKLGSFGLGAVLNALVILIALIAIIQQPNPVRKILKQTWLGFLAISMITLGFAPEFITALKTYLTLVSYAAIFALAITLIKSEEDYGRWMRAVFYSSIIPVVYGFIDAATGGFASSEGFRISSTFSHPNIFAFYLVLMISLGFYFYKSNASYIPLFFRRTMPIYIFLMLALLVMTKTRSAWATCFTFFTLYALIYERKYLVIIFLLPIVGLMIPEIRDRFTDLSQGNEVVNYSKLNSYAWRKMIWSQGLQAMEPAHYFLGYGLEAFKYYSAKFFTMSGGQQHGAHSVYVQLFYETGALGLGAFVWLHVKLGRLLLPFYKKNKLMIFSSIMFLLEFALNSYSDNMLSYLSFNWYLWFVLGATYAVGYAKQKQSEVASTQADDEQPKLNIGGLSVS